MKIPRKVKMYSPYAKKHTLHEIEVVKKKRASELARGQRKFRSVTSGYGGFPRPNRKGVRSLQREFMLDIDVLRPVKHIIRKILEQKSLS